MPFLSLSTANFLAFIYTCLYHRPVFSPGNLLRTVSDVWRFVVCFFVPLVSALKCTSFCLSPASLQLNVSWIDAHLTCLDLLSHAVFLGSFHMLVLNIMCRTTMLLSIIEKHINFKFFQGMTQLPQWFASIHMQLVSEVMVFSIQNT